MKKVFMRYALPLGGVFKKLLLQNVTYGSMRILSILYLEDITMTFSKNQNVTELDIAPKA